MSLGTVGLNHLPVIFFNIIMTLDSLLQNYIIGLLTEGPVRFLHLSFTIGSYLLLVYEIYVSYYLCC